MKPLNNPWVVGALCVVALGLAGYQFLAPHRRPGISPAAATPAPAPVPSRPSALSAHSLAPAQAAAPPSLIDQTYVLSHLAQWIEAPQRDPFLLPTASFHGAATGSPVIKWKLRAIWNQTGCRLAVINKGIYAEGDLVEGYRLEKIESDGVWLRGPTGREGLGFTKPQPPLAALNGTNGMGRQPVK